jgi:hypothetical protein
MTKPRPGNPDRGHADSTSGVERTPRPLPSTSPAVLRELAALIEARDPARQARQSLSPESLEELADMLLEHKRPTLRWWRRHLDSGFDHSKCCPLPKEPS